jgi:hypothetical protein
MRVTFPVLAALASLPAPAPVPVAWPQERVDAIVRAHYPARLEPRDAADRRSCHAVAPAARQTGARIVAAYTDTTTAVIRVLERRPDGVAVIYESPADHVTLALDCRVELVDLDGDRAPEALVRLNDPRATMTWVLRLHPAGVDDITPVERRGPESWTRLVNASLVDLYHDGTRQFVTGRGVPAEPGARVSEPPTIYRFRGTALADDGEALLARTFGARDLPPLRVARFNLRTGLDGRYVLHLVNGDRAGRRRASGIEISINGVPLAGVASFGATAEFLAVPLAQPLRDENEIAVAVRGADDAIVLVAIRPAR